jgi:hypothetical protein
MPALPGLNMTDDVLFYRLRDLGAAPALSEVEGVVNILGRSQFGNPAQYFLQSPCTFRIHFATLITWGRRSPVERFTTPAAGIPRSL